MTTTPALRFHPTLHVRNLDQAADWFSRVFSRNAIRWNQRWDFSLINADYPLDYSFLAHMGDVIIDVFAPTLYRLPGNAPLAPPSHEHLVDVAWWTDNAHVLAQHLEANDVRATDQSGAPIEAGDVPESFLSPDSFLLWTNPEDTGLAYEFMEIGDQHKPYYSQLADPRLEGRSIPVIPDDPLGIVRASHHTIVSGTPERAHRFLVDVLGGVETTGTGMMTEGRTLLELAGQRYDIRPADVADEFLTKVPAGRDYYLGITFEVEGVERVSRHLTMMGVPHTPSDGAIHTNPAHTLGVRWGFCPVQADRAV
jgi:catechol 2,3-dioxygenase-like lactoylglutathione lyase family enzyme